VIYGRNGTGKSSLTDAWEWFQTERIEHLAREGAGPSAYPHRQAVDGQTFVEVELSDASFGRLKVAFDAQRITLPHTTGDVARLRALIHHPCHVRFADLTQFVYLRKAERYDLLAQLMGFSPQVEFQKALRRVEHELDDKLGNAAEQVRAGADDLQALLHVGDVDEKTLVEALSQLLSKHGIAPAGSFDGLREGVAELKGRVERDPAAQRLAALSGLRRDVTGAEERADVLDALVTFVTEAQPFKQEEETLKQLLLLGVYEAGLAYLTQQGDVGICPLCNRQLDGDLTQHIQTETAKLKALRASYDRVDSKRTLALAALRRQLPHHESLAETLQGVSGEATAGRVRVLIADSTGLQEQRSQLIPRLEQRPEEMDEISLAELRLSAAKYSQLASHYNTERASLLRELSELIQTLEQDKGRTTLVEDFRKVDTALDLRDRHRRALVGLVGLANVSRAFQTVVDHFMLASIADVQRRFDLISDAVTRFFEILEANTPGIGKPVLRILLDQDRSVVPEVLFYGQATSPAYRYLSESQLNSFGLSVFLASVRHFNPDFRFVILDDVVNSLDGYKRPQLIKILKTDFQDSQVVLLTHDSVWRDRLYKELPSWKRIEFIRFDFGTGPVQGEALETLERVKKLIEDDQPVLAGQALGPYMEFHLQEICEAFEVEMKYNRRNEYTLDPLLDRLRVRVKSKLGAGHQLTQALDDLSAEAGFRNLSAHAKDPTIQLTPQEMDLVLKKWSAVEGMVRCQRNECYEILRYTDQGTFRCACGQTELKKGPL